MKKKLFASLLASATLLSIFAAGIGANASVKDSEDTEVGIGFSGHIEPPGTDPLTLKWAPQNLDFGSANAVNAAAAVFNEESGAKKYVVVSDGRPDTVGDKWELTAQLSDLKAGSAQLTGATLEYSATKKGYQGTAAPEVAGSIIPATAAHTATVVASSTLTQGAAAVKVMDDDGGSTSSYKGDTAMEMDNIKLNVPGGVAQSGKQYTGTVTWSLDDTI